MPEENNLSYLDNYLAHYGVVGMRWGKRGRSSSDSGSTKQEKPSKPPKMTSKERTAAIKKAREDLNPSADRALAAEKKYENSKTERGRKMAYKQLDKAATEYYTNLGRSLQKTRGEKIVTGLVMGVTMTAVASTVVKR